MLHSLYQADGPGYLNTFLIQKGKWGCITGVLLNDDSEFLCIFKGYKTVGKLGADQEYLCK